jgi:hypothetical protein
MLANIDIENHTDIDYNNLLSPLDSLAIAMPDMPGDPVKERGSIWLELTYPRSLILWLDHILLDCPYSYPLRPVFDLL